MKNTNFIRIKSVADLHRFIGFESPRHPLISLIDYSKVKPIQALSDYNIVNDLYLVSIKNIGPKDVRYGRSKYDFEEGCLIFMAPNQVYSIPDIDLNNNFSGFGLYFHPDLLSGTSLSKTISNYSFFEYRTNEALHLSDAEKQKMSLIFSNIEEEISDRIDNHTQEVLVHNIELLLKYSNRFYERQHITRKTLNTDTVSKFESLLKEYFIKNTQFANGLVEVKYFAEKMNLSSKYLSDILKRYTGKSVQEHINLHLIEKAKTELLTTNKSVAEIAFDLGFEYPQYFSRLFKQKEGLTPTEFRSMS
ncbi:helix-turn-helix domain-containing protein [Flavihumibacter cheonanensis]|uniref:helix-turn-helix domain-containing protein n=1 Tax=Flavihumibacter cheonanensis TaxID=1442385 RepID=UPI001EF8B043|nr:helix-turn-helix domain-containing protein [Flavihumibacter cheonanensis]MCG7753134.1 helix-turn-helix domain-containing protein [Flavihumibacter cheonanensis]